MKQQKDKKETDPIHNCTKKHKIPRNKPNQRCKRRRRHKEVEKHSMLMDWKKKYC